MHIGTGAASYLGELLFTYPYRKGSVGHSGILSAEKRLNEVREPELH